MQVDMPPAPLVDRLDRVEPTLPGLIIRGTPTQLLPRGPQIVYRALEALPVLLGQGHELEPMLAQLLKLGRIGVVEPIIILLATLGTRPIPTPRQGHVGMHGRTVLTAKGLIGMPVDRLSSAILEAFRLMCSCCKRGIK